MSDEHDEILIAAVIYDVRSRISNLIKGTRDMIFKSQNSLQTKLIGEFSLNLLASLFTEEIFHSDSEF